MDQPPVIVLIDEDPSFVQSVREYLAAHGYRVEVAPSAPEGIDRAIRLRADVVITEMLLPGGSGFHVAEQLKLRDRTLPVIMSTEFPSAVRRSLAALLGVDEFLSKPVPMNRLLESVRRWHPAGVNPPHDPARLKSAGVTGGG